MTSTTQTPVSPEGEPLRKTPKKKVYVYQEMSHLGLFLWALGCARMHKDGDGFCSVFRPWHPVNWLLLLILMPVCAVLGEKLLDAVPFRLSKFWRLNSAQLQWVRPWTRLDSLKPFDHSLAVRKPKKVQEEDSEHA